MYRTFKDRVGKIWDVWQVHPSAAERRFVQRRVHDEPRTDAKERRSGLERRAGETARTPHTPRPAEPPHHRAPVPAEYAKGWLCFETVGEKRRLAPVPEGWQRADDETIEQWCSIARPVTRRPSGSIRGTGGTQKLG